MSSMDPTPEEKPRKERLDELLLMIGGLEESIRSAMDQKVWPCVRRLEALKPKYYEKLRRAAYGLSEERPAATEE